MRRLASTTLLVSLACLLGFSSAARAGITIDVVFQDAASPSGITIDARDPGPGCTFGGYYNGSVSTGYCMDVIMTTTWDFLQVGISVAYDGDNGLAISSMKEWSGIPAIFGKLPTLTPCIPDAALADNGGIIQSFDCTAQFQNPGNKEPAGTYRLGTIIWDTSKTTPGYEVIQALLASGDGFLAVINGNLVDVSASVVLGSHILTIIPEPGTATLLGLGFVGLVLAARRRRPLQH